MSSDYVYISIHGFEYQCKEIDPRTNIPGNNPYSYTHPFRQRSAQIPLVTTTNHARSKFDSTHDTKIVPVPSLSPLHRVRDDFNTSGRHKNPASHFNFKKHNHEGSMTERMRGGIHDPNNVTKNSNATNDIHGHESIWTNDPNPGRNGANTSGVDFLEDGYYNVVYLKALPWGGDDMDGSVIPNEVAVGFISCFSISFIVWILRRLKNDLSLRSSGGGGGSDSRSREFARDVMDPSRFEHIHIHPGSSTLPSHREVCDPSMFDHVEPYVV